MIATVAPLLKLDPADLSFTKAYKDPQGDAHYRYGVRRNGIAVYGGELRLHARDGEVFAANTNARGDLKARGQGLRPPRGGHRRGGGGPRDARGRVT